MIEQAPVARTPCGLQGALESAASDGFFRVTVSVSPQNPLRTTQMASPTSPDVAPQTLWDGLATRRLVLVLRQNDGAILVANALAEQSLGFDEGELIGRTLAELHDEFELDLVQCRHDLTHGLVAEGELRLSCRDGSDRWLFVESLPHPDIDGATCRLLLARDVQAEIDARSEQRGRLAALERGQGIAEYDLDGKLLRANDIFMALMHGSEQELAGMAHSDMCDPLFAQSGGYADWWQRIRLGEVDEGTRRYAGLSGRAIWLREVFNPTFDAAGRPYKVIQAALDVTKSRSAELQLLESMSYAGRIQMAMHEPSRDILALHLPQRHAVMWQPREAVGGDCFMARAVGDRIWFCLFDCTGHGAPGAILATLVLSVVDRILARDGGLSDPGTVLQRLNRRIKVVLDQEQERIEQLDTSDDGVDGIVFCLEPARSRAIVASTGLPLFVLEPAKEGVIHRWPGGGLGYRGVPTERRWDNREIRCTPDTRLFVATDGVFDQVGGSRGRGYGAVALARSLQTRVDLPITEQAEGAMHDFEQFQGSQRRRDDVALAGLQLPTGRV